MPSPFPGMDPYLEDPALWRGVHHWLITAAAEQLQPQLVHRGCYVDIESRIWLEEPERAVYPDVALLRATHHPAAPSAEAQTLTADEPVRVHGLEAEVREDYLQIYETATRRLLTGIEIVSPSNKSDSEARELYVRNRRELRAAGVNVVEIDLLRGGKPVVRLPQGVLAGSSSADYIVNVIRGGDPDYEFYPVSLRSRLPRIRIPVRAGEPDVLLDLQSALDRVYEAGAYRFRIAYTGEPIPPLSADEACWAGELLSRCGLRGQAS